LSVSEMQRSPVKNPNVSCTKCHEAFHVCPLGFDVIWFPASRLSKAWCPIWWTTAYLLDRNSSSSPLPWSSLSSPHSMPRGEVTQDLLCDDRPGHRVVFVWADLTECEQGLSGDGHPHHSWHVGPGRLICVRGVQGYCEGDERFGVPAV
jgi:hypothetical protein